MEGKRPNLKKAIHRKAVPENYSPHQGTLHPAKSSSFGAWPPLLDESLPVDLFRSMVCNQVPERNPERPSGTVIRRAILSLERWPCSHRRPARKMCPSTCRFSNLFLGATKTVVLTVGDSAVAARPSCIADRDHPQRERNSKLPDRTFEVKISNRKMREAQGGTERGVG